MLPKKNRADRKTIAQIFKEGKFVNSQNLTFRYLKIESGKESTNSRISFIVPKTVSKSAVNRNKLRRQGYVSLKKHLTLPPFPIAGVFIFGKKAINNSMQNIENEIKNIFNKIPNKIN